MIEIMRFCLVDVSSEIGAESGPSRSQKNLKSASRNQVIKIMLLSLQDITYSFVILTEPYLLVCVVLRMFHLISSLGVSEERVVIHNPYFTGGYKRLCSSFLKYFYLYGTLGTIGSRYHLCCFKKCTLYFIAVFSYVN